GKGFEPLGLGIEAQDRVCSPVAHPHGIGVIDVDRVGLRPVARQMPALPTIVLAIVAEQISSVPTGIHSPPRLSLQTRRASCRGTGGSKTVVVPVSISIRPR